jgi:hypothetical protein
MHMMDRSRGTRDSGLGDVNYHVGSGGFRYLRWFS